MTRSLLFIFLLSWLCGCSPLSKSSMNKKIKAIDTDLQDHTGFVLYDVSKKKTLFEYNASKYFTPASNTKIFTLFASLKILGDSVPAFRYRETKDSLIIRGTGDPSFLYKNVFDNGRAYNFLSSSAKPIYISLSNFYTPAFGPGWAWDDYSDYYSAERSPFPVYGNIFSVDLVNNKPVVTPRYFRKYFSIGEEVKERNTAIRQLNSNTFCFYWGKRKTTTKTWDVPIKVDNDLTVLLLRDTLKKAITPLRYNAFDSLKLMSAKTFYSIPTDSLYSELMQESDNFIAEQLLLMCADVIDRDSLNPEIVIKYVKENFLKDLKDEPIWVDGSGLSRYNLFTPRTIIQMWEKILAIKPAEQLFPLLATGGVNGTIKKWYKGDEKPYVFAKTGTVSNVHCLSGFLITRSGKTLIFSFMNNNFTASNNKVRTHMQEILKMIYENY